MENMEIDELNQIGRDINMGFVFTDNKQLKNEFKKLAIDNGTTMSNVAKICGLFPQQLNNRFANNRLAFTDLKRYLGAIGYDLEISFVKRDGSMANGSADGVAENVPDAHVDRLDAGDASPVSGDGEDLFPWGLPGDTRDMQPQQSTMDIFRAMAREQGRMV